MLLLLIAYRGSTWGFGKKNCGLFIGHQRELNNFPLAGGLPTESQVLTFGKRLIVCIEHIMMLCV